MVMDPVSSGARAKPAESQAAPRLIPAPEDTTPELPYCFLRDTWSSEKLAERPSSISILMNRDVSIADEKPARFQAAPRFSPPPEETPSCPRTKKLLCTLVAWASWCTESSYAPSTAPFPAVAVATDSRVEMIS